MIRAKVARAARSISIYFFPLKATAAAARCRAPVSYFTLSSFSYSLPVVGHHLGNCFPCSYRIDCSYYSSDSESHLFENSNDISQKSTSKLTHESVIYALKKLGKSPLKAMELFRQLSEKNSAVLTSTACSLVLISLSHTEWMQNFWFFLKEMASKGYIMDADTYQTLVSRLSEEKLTNDVAVLRAFYEERVPACINAVVKILLESDWNEDVKKKLEDMKPSLSTEILLQILRKVHLYPSRALGFFRWFQEFSDHKHHSVAYNTILKILALNDTLEEFWNMVKEMKYQDYEIDFDTYVKLLRQFLKRKKMEDAVMLYELMVASPYKPSVQDCSLLLRQISLNATPDLDLVYRVVRKYEAAGFSLSKAVYDGIHRSLTTLGRFDEADKVLETMRNAGFDPDNITYGQTVFGLCKFERLDDACNMLDYMETMGCPPDVKTWTILIQGHCSAGKIDRGISCFTKMIEKNCDADACVLDVLVNGLISKSRVDNAYTLVVEMVEKKHMRPWQATYKHLIDQLLESKKLEKAFKLLELMKSHSFPPYPDPFIKYISKHGTVLDAVDFLSVLSVKRLPSSVSYKNLLAAFVKEDRHSEAQDLLYKFPHHVRSQPDILKLFSSPKVVEAS